MSSALFVTLRREVGLLAKTYLGFSARPAGDYTRRQLSAGAAYTLFCHAEFEAYIESWARLLTDLALSEWNTGRVTRPLLHLSAFNGGRNELTSVPSRDIWGELVINSVRKHQTTIAANHGIKETNVCRLLAPLGFDLRKIDPLLLADLNAFASMRGAHAHQSHSAQLATVVDPFDRKAKAQALLLLLQDLDNELELYLASA